MTTPADAPVPNSQGALPADIAQTPSNGSPQPAPAPNAKPAPTPPTPEQIAAAAASEHGDGIVPKAKDAPKDKTPPAEPAADPAAAPNLDPEPAAEVQWVTLEDPSGQAALDLLKEGGVTPVEAESIFGDALTSGDMSKVKWDVLEARLGKSKAHLVKTGVIDYNNRVAEGVRETTKKVYDVVGGADNFNKVKAWVAATEKADPASKAKFDSIRRGLDAGGYTAELVAKDLRSMYEADPKNNGLGTSKVTGGDKPSGEVTGGPIDKKTYQTEIRKAYANNDQKAVASLRARRLAGQQNGL